MIVLYSNLNFESGINLNIKQAFDCRGEIFWIISINQTMIKQLLVCLFAVVDQDDIFQWVPIFQ